MADEETYSTYQVATACGYAVTRIHGSCSGLTAWRRDLGLPKGGSGSKHEWTFSQALAIRIGKTFDHPFDVRMARMILSTFPEVNLQPINLPWWFTCPTFTTACETAEQLMEKWELAGFPFGTVFNLNNEKRKLKEALDAAAPIG